MEKQLLIPIIESVQVSDLELLQQMLQNVNIVGSAAAAVVRLQAFTANLKDFKTQ